MTSHPHHVTTTHSAWGAGAPRLLISRGETRTVYELEHTHTRIGSSADNELVLDGTEPLHATVQHDERDEYVLIMHGPGETSGNPDTQARPGTLTLRTGARFTAGPWTFVFMRAEYADHGRPFGGRQGGEFSDQAPQPARFDYSRPTAEQSPRPLEVQDD